MTPFPTAISTPNAWTNGEIGGKAGLTYRPTSAQLAAFDALLAQTRHLQPHNITRDDFRHPEIDALTARLDRTIRHGRDGLRIENDRPIAGEIMQRAAIYERIYRERSGRVPMEAA